MVVRSKGVEIVMPVSAKSLPKNKWSELVLLIEGQTVRLTLNGESVTLGKILPEVFKPKLAYLAASKARRTASREASRS